MEMDVRTVRKAMAWLSVGMTAVTVLLRVWLLPTLRDSETGLFGSGEVVIALLLLVLAALAVGGFLSRGPRLEVASPTSLWVSVAALTSGGLVLVSGLWDGWLWLAEGEIPAPQAATDTTLGIVVLVLQVLCSLLGGAALVYFGLMLLSEGRTRPGIAGWSMLLPVLWMWFRLARYEMSYVSAVRLSQSFYDVVMFVLELLFLFRLARYAAGAGKVGAGLLQFLSCATAVFALSAPLVRLGLYLLGDGEAFRASQLAGLPDVAVGLLALAMAFALIEGKPVVQESPVPAESVEPAVSDEAEELMAPEELVVPEESEDPSLDAASEE